MHWRDKQISKLLTTSNHLPSAIGVTKATAGATSPFPELTPSPAASPAMGTSPGPHSAGSAAAGGHKSLEFSAAGIGFSAVPPFSPWNSNKSQKNYMKNPKIKHLETKENKEKLSWDFPLSFTFWRFGDGGLSSDEEDLLILLFPERDPLLLVETMTLVSFFFFFCLFPLPLAVSLCLQIIF